MKKKRFNFKKYLIIFIVASFILLLALILDNIFWINASPEWDTYHVVVNKIGSWTGKVSGYTFGQFVHYVFGYRVYSVLTNLRDLGSAMIFGFFMTCLIMIYDIIMRKRFILGKYHY